MIAALFWRRSTKYGALASTLWVAAWLALTWYVQKASDGMAPKPGQPAVVVFSALGHFFERSTANVTVYGFLPVVPMVFGSAALMVLVSLVTAPPSRGTIQKYFPNRATKNEADPEGPDFSSGSRKAAPLHQPSS